MRTTARVGAVLSFSAAAAAGAADLYAIREDIPETGSNIPRAVVVWPVPINRRYEELTADQRRIVRDDYVRLASDDEPAYPRDGMEAILTQVARIQSNQMDTGRLHFAVKVDANGNPRGVAVLASPNAAIAQAVSYALMDTQYKPARCDGKACESEFSFKYRFEASRPRTYHGEWAPVMWMAPRRRE
jgi:hypothetical protein